jgi:hypothetical protein
MPSGQRVKNKLPHELDLTGIAVAFAFLVFVGVYAGGRDPHTAIEDQQPLSASLHTEPTFVSKNLETVPPSNDAEKTSLSDTSHRLNVPSESAEPLTPSSTTP